MQSNRPRAGNAAESVTSPDRKEMTGIPVRFLRDGVHGMNDLAVILKFQNEGFLYDIKSYKSKYDENAICVEFHYVSKENGYI